MATANIYNADANKVMQSAIKDGMEWLKDVSKPEWTWHDAGNDAWWYGASESSRAVSEYVYVDRIWRYFGDNAYWQRPKDDDSKKWDWIQESSGKRYGNKDKYYARKTYVYITMDGQMKEYWFDDDGYWDGSDDTDSSYAWHGSGTSADPWWFGEDGATSEDTNKFLHGGWWFIDGTYYYFDEYGYYDGTTKFENYQWDWVEASNSKWWFGNDANRNFARVYVTNQWLKVGGDWYRFDANGYAIGDTALENEVIARFTSGMAQLKTLCETLNTQAFNLLYSQMRSYCTKMFNTGIDVPNVTITVNMADLSNTSEYAKYQHLEKVYLGDSVTALDYKHNISAVERIVSITYDCIKKVNAVVEIGVASSSLSDILKTDAGGSVAGGFDTSVIESTLTNHTNELARLDSAKQNKLTAGENISIENNVISATGGGQGLEYWEETSQRFYRDYKVDGISADEGFKKTEWKSAHWSGYDSTAGYLYRNKNVAKVIVGEVSDSSSSSDCRRIVIASTNEDDLEWEWATCRPSKDPLTPTSEWGTKETYPLVPSQYPAYQFGWQTDSITFNGATWYIMAIQTAYGDGYTHFEAGDLSIKNAGAGAMQMTCAQLGQFLLEQIHASNKVDAQVSIGVNDNVFQWVIDGEEVAWINEDGTSSFDREETKEVIPLTQEEYDDLPSSKLTDDKAYFITASRTLDPSYDYYEYEDGQGGKIVVRTHNNETRWYFMGWHQTSGDMAIPSELTAYKPTDYTPIYSANYPDGGTSQNGWIGFYNNKIRAWSQNLGSLITGVMYGVVNIDGGDNQTYVYKEPYVWIPSTERKIIVNGENYIASGGTDVEANPSGTATDTLNTIGIDGTIYSLSVKGLTQAEYDALPSSKNSDGVAYFVDDSGTYKIMFNGHNYSGT
jgi:hypothetical protein